jgi:hypothetical protein
MQDSEIILSENEIQMLIRASPAYDRGESRYDLPAIQIDPFILSDLTRYSHLLREGAVHIKCNESDCLKLLFCLLTYSFFIHSYRRSGL